MSEKMAPLHQTPHVRLPHMTQIFVGTCVPFANDTKYYICHWDRNVAHAVATGSKTKATIENDYTRTSVTGKTDISIVRGLYGVGGNPTGKSAIVETVIPKNGKYVKSGRPSGIIVMPLGHDSDFLAANGLTLNPGEVEIGVCTLSAGTSNSECTGLYGTGSRINVPTRFLTDLPKANKSDARRIRSAYATRVLDASIDTLRTGEPVWTTAESTV